MGFIKKYTFIIAAICIIGLFFVTRLYNILSLPIFTDEAIYVRWAQIAANDASWRFISLTDGKQPLFVWIAMILMDMVKDPLLAGRLVSVIAGFFSMIGMFLLGSEVFKNKRIGLLASLLYVLFPFALVYDRLALYDSLVALFIIWALYFEILLVKYVRLDLAIILGVIAGFGMLTKTNASFALILLPFSLLLFDFTGKKRNMRILKWIGCAVISIFVAAAMYQILRLSPFFHIIAEKNYVFIYTPQEWLQHPLTYIFNNLRPMSEWVLSYITVPMLVLIGASFLVGKKYLKERLLLLVWFIAPFMALALFGRVLYPRFILFMTMPLIVLSAYSLFHMLTIVKKVWLQAIVVIVFLVMFVINDYWIITDFTKAPIPQADRGQFITGWPAGGGVRETVAFLEEKAQKEKIYVGTGGTFGLMPYALEIYLHDNPNIKVVGFWPVEGTPPKEVTEAAKKQPTYFVFYQECPSCPGIGKAPLEWKVTPVLQIEKMEKGSFYTLYQVKSQ